MWIVKNRGKNILAIIKGTKTLNSFFKKVPEHIQINQSTTSHYPPKYPFFIVKYKKDNVWEFDTFSKIRTSEELSAQYGTGEVYKITKALVPKTIGEDVLAQLKGIKFESKEIAA